MSGRNVNMVDLVKKFGASKLMDKKVSGGRSSVKER